MTAPNRQQHKNDGISTLSGAIDDTVTSLDVANGTKFPSSGNFRILIEDEVLLCTARSSNTLTVIRGYDGTVAASHGDTTAVYQIYNKEGITELFKDNDALFGYSTRPPKCGLWGNDGQTILTSSDFTWLNQNSATITDRGGTMLMKCPTRSGLDLNGLEITAPSTPWSYIIGLRGIGLSSGASDAKPGWGVALRETSSSKLEVLQVCNESFFSNGNTLRGYLLNSPTSGFSFATIGQHLHTHAENWFKVTDNGTNISFSISSDGVEWVTLRNTFRNTFFSTGPDRILWFGNNQTNTGSGGTTIHVECFHWSKGE